MNKSVFFQQAQWLNLWNSVCKKCAAPGSEKKHWVMRRLAKWWTMGAWGWGRGCNMDHRVHSKLMWQTRLTWKDAISICYMSKEEPENLSWVLSLTIAFFICPSSVFRLWVTVCCSLRFFFFYGCLLELGAQQEE